LPLFTGNILFLHHFFSENVLFMGILKDILSISGQSGLFKFVSQGRNGIIVESLENGKRQHANATAKISALEDIAIYTNEKEMPLEEVFKVIKASPDVKVPDYKSDNKDLKSFFDSIIPDYNKDRVYVSDIKKVVRWYKQLEELKMLDFEKAEKEEKKEKQTGNEKKTGKGSSAAKEPSKKSTPKAKPESGNMKNTQSKKPVVKKTLPQKTTGK
jgi:hypothetical protein